uniref:Methyltransferase domain-containing protein n=1 Tax=Macrostomum lignano TaxID=282301 RepID=A0A1I8HFA9_9PLAT
HILQAENLINLEFLRPGRQAIRLKIPSDPLNQLGARLWPSSLKLSCLLMRQLQPHQDEQLGTCLELGCGCGLAGAMALALGARRVTFTDSSPKVLNRCAKQCRLNGFSMSAASSSFAEPDLKRFKASVGEFDCRQLCWGSLDQLLQGLADGWLAQPLDLILASDCLYDPAVFDSFFATLSGLFRLASPVRLGCLMSAHNRNPDWGFARLLARYGLRATPLILDDADSVEACISADCLASLPADFASCLLEDETVQLFRVTPEL